MTRFYALAVIGALTIAAPALGAMTDAQVKQTIIRESIASYPGPCACPYSTMRNGRACGGRSAYSKPGGYDPICYPAQVTKSMIQQYRAAHGG